VEEGWAPEWLWPIDSAGLLVMPDDRSSGARTVTYCPRLARTAGSPVTQMLSPHGEVRGN
jgi:hypothetical protein